MGRAMELLMALLVELNGYPRCCLVDDKHLGCSNKARCRKLVIEAITGWTFLYLSKLKPEGTERTCEHVAANSLFQPGRLQPSTSITTAEYYDPVATSLYLQLALH
ncbi:Uncharacterized protein Fot_04053 [Forsythia ovata]|uniref:Uncharacterized protein n=1 Tax=Forsythia ovata TaxID=205694 RepID=A0ABD1XBG6_9LAMI